MTKMTTFSSSLRAGPQSYAAAAINGEAGDPPAKSCAGRRKPTEPAAKAMRKILNDDND
jgi:hypothetical protein